MRNFRIEFIPFEKINTLSSKRKLNMIIKAVKNNSVIITDGKLTAEEEAELIGETMRKVSKNFPGIEICSFNSADFRAKETQVLSVLKETVLDVISGKRRGITIIGPAALVSKIKKDPDKISLLLKY